MKTPTTPGGKPKAIALSKLPKGEFVRLASYDKGNVWIKGDLDRKTGRYTLTKAEDVNHECYRKGSFTVFAGFTY